MPGFPIRTSSDPRSVGSSPRHIAASHVLHRLPVPRHPPCALKHLQHKTELEIAHQHNKKHAHNPTHPTKGPARSCAHTFLAARCSQPLSTNQTPHPTTKMERHTNPLPAGTVSPTPVPPPSGRRAGRPVASKPNSVSGGYPPKGTQSLLLHQNLKPTTGQAHPTNCPGPDCLHAAGRP